MINHIPNLPAALDGSGEKGRLPGLVVPYCSPARARGGGGGTARANKHIGGGKVYSTVFGINICLFGIANVREEQEQHRSDEVQYDFAEWEPSQWEPSWNLT